MQNISYRLTVDFNYDPVQDLIIQTRCVKRDFVNYTNTQTQFLKAETKKFEPNFILAELYNQLRENQLISYDFDLTEDQLSQVMEKNFNLFDDILQNSGVLSWGRDPIY